MRRYVQPALLFLPLALLVLAAMLARRRRGSCRGGWTWELSPEAPDSWR